MQRIDCACHGGEQIGGELGGETVLGPAGHCRKNPISQQRGNNGEHSHFPDFVGVQGEQAGNANAQQKREDGAQGKQKSISRQDEAAELEEVRMHTGKLRRNRPTGPCSSAPVNPS